MKLKSGELTLDRYLLDPVGMEFQFSTDLAFLINVFLASGRMIIPRLLMVFSIIATSVTLLFVLLYAGRRGLDFSPASYMCVFGTLVLLAGLSEATVLSFQVGLLTSRFVFYLLLAVLIWCQVYSKPRLHVAALSLACLAVSFCPAGGMFAIEVFLVHVVFFKGWRRLLCSTLLFASFLLFNQLYVKAGAEIPLILHNLNVPTVLEIIHGAICYYATPLVWGWPTDMHISYGVSEIVLLVIGFFIGASTVVWGLFTLFSIILKIRRGKSIGGLDCAAGSSCRYWFAHPRFRLQFSG
jgi:hypothetical protein